MKYLLTLLLLTSCAQAPVKTKTVKYKRQEWPHWVDTNKDCQNTRQEILIARSLEPVKLNKKGCTVVAGKWEDYYYPETHTSPQAVDIDHLIPLKHAHSLGADKWTLKERELFANDPENLVITNKTYNRQKGAKTIAEWLPVHQDYACKYIKDWIRVKKKYQLTITADETKAIATTKCPQ